MKFAVDEATATVDAACEAIAELEKEDLSEKKQKTIAKQLLSALPYLEHLKYEYPHRELPFKLYRVRADKGIGKEEPVNEVKTFSYPSPEKCDTARANKKGCPVFYVADNAGTALKEAGCKKGDIVYVSEWDVSDASNARLFLFFEQPLPQKHSWEKVRGEQEKQFHQSLANTSAELKEKWHQLHTAYCKAFLGEEYTISSLIGHELLHANKKPEIDVLVYPSTVDADHYCNLAIHPDFTDNHLQMAKIWKIKVTDKEVKEQPELLEIGEAKGKQIIWRKATPQEQKEFSITN